MSKSTPSLLALLGLVAVAGYQNRSRISEMLSDARHATPSSDDFANENRDGFLSEINRIFQSGTVGSSLSRGLADLVNQFKSAGSTEPAESWVADGPNMPMNVDEMERILGSETLQELSTKTGLPRAQLLLRLNAALPDVVNNLTPNGRIPTESEVQILA